MTEEYQEFDAGLVDSIDQSTVEEVGSLFPFIQWHYGDQKLKQLKGSMTYMGGWFIKADSVDEAVMLAAGWKKETWIHDNGKEVDGFWTPDLTVSVIAKRRRWEVNADGTQHNFARDDYNKAQLLGKVNGRTQALVLIKGLEKQGLFVLTLKNSGSMAFDQGGFVGPGAITRFTQTVISRANQESDAAAKKAGKPTGKKWPYRAFWLTVGANRDSAGNSIFVESSKNKDTSKLVCVPTAFGLPDKAEQVDLKRYFVGKELLDQVNQLFQDNQEWFTGWDAITPGAPDKGGAATVEDTAAADADLAANAAAQGL